MKRRDFIAFLGGATALVVTARAQEPRRTIGVLGSAFYGAFPGSEAAFVQGLKDSGFIDGKNISIEWRWAEGQYGHLPSLIGELISSSVAVIVTWDVPSSFAAKAATRTIPIVFAIGADPVRLGLVDSLNQPRGNLTGVTSFLSSLGPKQLELLHELLPGSSTTALLVNTGNLNSKIDISEVQAAADSLGQHLEVVTASTENELETAFATMVRKRVDALVVKPDPFFIHQRERLVALAAHHAVPTIYSFRVFAEVGGLISYGTRLRDAYEHAGTYAGRILKGAKPADLPVQQSITFELVINLKTVKALGLTVPPSLLASADEVIE
jgi:putative ABC transport system substrate-binding protein